MTGTIEAVLAKTVRTLRNGGIETPALDARLLVMHATELSHEALIAHGRAPLEPEAAKRLEAAVARRLDGEPVSRIRGLREFYGREFLIDAHTLDPRADTETLVDTALDLVARKGWQERPLRLLDLGTGTGCILLSLLAELPLAQGLGTDISAGALRLAARNARRLGLDGRVRFLAADWLEGVAGPFDLILANPPYIATGEIAGLAREVAGYDPRGALDGGPDGLDAYRQIAQDAGRALRPGGQILVEIGATQAEAVSGLFRAGALEVGGAFADLGGRPRCVVAERPLAPGIRGRESAKISLETPDVRARFVARNEDVRSARGLARPVAWQQEQIS